jgi:hypothetical protein
MIKNRAPNQHDFPLLRCAADLLLNSNWSKIGLAINLFIYLFFERAFGVTMLEDILFFLGSFFGWTHVTGNKELPLFYFYDLKKLKNKI